MNEKAAKSLETVRALTASWAAGESVPDVTSLTRAVLEAFERGGVEALLPLWAAGRLAEDEPAARRALSFAIARYSPDFGGDRWLPVLWLLAPPHPTDLSTIHNTLTALQRHPEMSGVALRMLCREIGPFLIHALRRDAELTESVTDVLYGYLDAGKIEHVLAAPTARALQERLRTPDKAVSAPVAEVATALAADLHGRAFPDEFPGVIEELRSFLDSRTTPATTDEWSQLLHWTEEGVREFAERYIAFEELTAIAVARNVPAHDLRVTGRWATVGKLPIDFLESILRAWRRLYSDVRGILAADSEQPALFVLAPSRGSFVLRVLVEAPETALAIDESVAREIVASAEGVGDAPDHALVRAAEFAPILRLAADHGVDLEIGIAVPGPAGGRHRIRFPHVRARRDAARLTIAEAPSGSPSKIEGVLDGANHRTGRFEMLPKNGGAPIVGNVARSGRSILLDKTIGNTYVFEVSRGTDPVSGAERWGLLRLNPTGDETAKTTLAAREVLAPLPDVITSGLVPQTDSLDRITQVVQIVASGAALSAETIDLSQRHIDYHKHAARLLHLLSEEGLLLPAGATLVALAPDRRLDHLAIQFEVSVCGQAWMKWAGVTRVADLDPETAFDFLSKRSNLTLEMIKRRGRTLRRWARDLGKQGTEEATSGDE